MCEIVLWGGRILWMAAGIPTPLALEAGKNLFSKHTFVCGDVLQDARECTWLDGSMVWNGDRVL